MYEDTYLELAHFNRSGRTSAERNAEREQGLAPEVPMLMYAPLTFHGLLCKHALLYRDFSSDGEPWLHAAILQRADHPDRLWSRTAGL